MICVVVATIISSCGVFTVCHIVCAHYTASWGWSNRTETYRSKHRDI